MGLISNSTRLFCHIALALGPMQMKCIGSANNSSIIEIDFKSKLCMFGTLAVS